MKHSVNLDGHIQVCDSEITITYVLVGRRSYDWQAPAQEVLDRAQKDGSLLSPAEYVAVRAWKRAIAVEGKYCVHVLGWAVDQGEAESYRELFSAPEWDQQTLRILPVETS